jgi:MFS family permease
MNMVGNIGGALSPIVFGVLVHYRSRRVPFIIAAVLLVFGAGVWTFWLTLELSAIESGRVGRVAVVLLRYETARA